MPGPPLAIISLLRTALSIAGAAGLVLSLGSVPASAYRPFEGTDAGVAALGEAEIELQPIGRFQQAHEAALIAPAVVFNYGFAPGWEFVAEGVLNTPLQGSGRSNVSDVALNLKHVLVEGVLQDKKGPSIATEFGILLPGTDASEGSRAGASLAGIISQRFDWGTAHLNLRAERTRDDKTDLFVGTILEGPESWKIRPVAEVYYEDAIGKQHTASGLVGLIWQARENIAIDLADRQAWVNHESVNEIRAGITFGFKPFDGARELAH
jgi:hypothetical protein